MPTANEIAVLQTARRANIITRNELANFMAQMSHESGGLERLEESFQYTRGIDQIPVQSAFREGREALERARLAALDGQPRELARLMYGARLGNDDAGDGYLYRGRGFTQLTGEENYRAAGVALGLELVTHPDLAADLVNASRISVWYWQERVPQADRDDVTAATLAINGGENGLRDRHERFDAWYVQLTPEFLADLDAGRVRPDAGVGPARGFPAMEDGALRRYESGVEVRQLQSNLLALGTTRGNRHIGNDGIYDRGTEQAIRDFQATQQIPVTGRADRETLEFIQDALLREQPHRDLPVNQIAPPMGVRGTQGEHPQLPAQEFRGVPPGHHDYALFDAIRRRLPDGTTDEKSAEVTMRAKTLGGLLHPGQIDTVLVQADRVFVMGKVPGFRIDANLSTPAPAVQESLGRMEAFDRQQLQFAQSREQQVSVNQDQGAMAPGMYLPG